MGGGGGGGAQRETRECQSQSQSRGRTLVADAGSLSLSLKRWWLVGRWRPGLRVVGNMRQQQVADAQKTQTRARRCWAPWSGAPVLVLPLLLLLLVLTLGRPQSVRWAHSPTVALGCGRASRAPATKT